MGKAEFEFQDSLVSKIKEWLKSHPFSPSDLDCTNTVMLKILDGKCKMSKEDKVVMAALYIALDNASGPLLADDIHLLIRQGREDDSELMQNLIYEKRVLAETMISRPVMKAYKRKIREQGLFEHAGIHSYAIA